METETFNFDFGTENEFQLEEIFEDNSILSSSQEDNVVTPKDDIENSKEEEIEEVEEKVEDVKSETKKTSNSEPSIYTDVYKDLKSYGILKHTEIDENEDLDADKLAELYEQDYEQEVKNRVKEWVNQTLDEEAQAFINFKQAGGNTRDFVKYMALEENHLPQGDLEDEYFQDEVIRLQLSNEGLDSDEIEEELEFLTERGKKESVAKRYYNKLKVENDKKREAFLKEQEEKALAQEKAKQDFNNQVSNILTNSDEVKGFKITAKDKQNLYKFLTKKDVKVGEGQYVTKFQSKLAEALSDGEKYVFLAKLLESDFDLSSYEKAIKSTEVRKIKSNLENRKGLTRSNSGSSTKGLSLDDLFGN